MASRKMPGSARARRRGPATPSGRRAPSVIVADDHPMFRSALHLSITKLFPDARVIEADSFAALKKAAQQNPSADLVLLDLMMPGARGFSSLLHLRRAHPALRIAVVSGVEEPICIRSALTLGAVAYLPKTLPPGQTQDVLARVLAGETWRPPTVDDASDDSEDQQLARKVGCLSPQELRVLLALGDGRMNKQIAGDMGISEGTVKVHMKSVLRKLGLPRRTQAALLAQRLLSAEPDALRGVHEAARAPSA